MSRTTGWIAFGTTRVDGALIWVKDVSRLSRLPCEASFLGLWFRVTFGLVVCDLLEMLGDRPIGFLGNGCLEVSGRGISTWKAKNVSDSCGASKYRTWSM